MVPERRRVSFSAESLFGFDASAVRPEGKTALDSFVREVAGSRYDSISIEGHTDRLGSSDYNQNLSLQRAESVKDYLVRFGGLEAAKLHAVGMGQNSPTTKDVACGEGEQATQALKACLQPDRRVEIEVSATK
jgi:OOP family OmpA-OmpF porin